MDLKYLEEDQNWLVEKYGSDKFVTPFNVSHDFTYEHKGSRRIEYQYQLVQGENQEVQPERAVNMRSFILADPNEYYGNQRAANADEMFVVNGQLTRSDGNFVSDF